MSGRHFRLNRHDESAGGEGFQDMVLENYPIRIVHSITDKGTGSNLDPLSYSFAKKGDIGVIYKDNGWSRRGYPTGLVPDHILSKEYLLVDYTAGYVLPKDVNENTNPE